MRAHVDQYMCIGCGQCGEICPEVFDMENEKSFVHADPVPIAAEAACQAAADACPVTAITLE